MNKFDFDELLKGIDGETLDKLFNWFASVPPSVKAALAKECSDALVSGDSLLEDFFRKNLGESTDLKALAAKIFGAIYG